ncbi:MAG: right-handed parallel beta-helix repeat-containing protein [Candidatus Bathyarchaeota archaeon]|nr:MAG: right-handed parallel beta-helix repeat-containing protein [Candidatus Bathyarchaeota archaeon]
MRKKAFSGIMLTLLLTSMLTLAFNIQPAKASGTIYITSDYTFTHNIYEPIVVLADNIVIDGNGYTLQGTGSGTGIELNYRHYVTIKNMRIKAFEYGIWLGNSSNNNIFGNNMTNNYNGIWLGNSSDNTFRNNSMVNNKLNIKVFSGSGLPLSDYVNDVDASNTVDGKPVYYLINKQEMTIPLDAGYVALINCTNITVQNLNLTNNGQGALLAYTTNSTITKNSISKNFYGILLYWSSNNSISWNNITNNYDGEGVRLSGYSNHNAISRNAITNSYHGIVLWSSSNNTISGNNITNNNNFGVHLWSSSNYNTISGNNITANNDEGVYLHSSFSNRFYHNNFVDNTPQVNIATSGFANFWDDGYPSGGNYWSDYNGADSYSGPGQNQLGSDGIGDTPYVMDGDNQDNYPLMNPWTPAPPTVVATVNVVPNTLNLKSNGEWTTCYIELPEGYNVSAIDIYSIRLSDTFPVSFLSNPPVPVPTEIGDYDNDTIPDLMVKFNRTALTSHIYHTLGIEYGNVTLTITGNLTDGTRFEGKDTVKVKFGGDADMNGLVELDDFDIWQDNFGKKPNKCPPDVYPDFNNDGLVDMLDFFVWRENFGATVPPQP